MRPGYAGLHTWLEEQKRNGAFKGPVHGPLAVEMTVPDANSHAAVIEAVRARRCAVLCIRPSGRMAKLRHACLARARPPAPPPSPPSPPPRRSRAWPLTLW